MKKYSSILFLLFAISIVFSSFNHKLSSYEVPKKVKQEENKKLQANKSKSDTVKKDLVDLQLQADSIVVYKGKFKPYKKKAHASYYHDKFDGRRTASGKKYNKNKFTAAHKKLPFGTIVKVTNEKNGRSVIVEINDRGPFVKGREIDLSRKAFFSVAANSRTGYVSVTLEVLQK